VVHTWRELGAWLSTRVPPPHTGLHPFAATPPDNWTDSRFHVPFDRPESFTLPTAFAPKRGTPHSRRRE
ncbi:hypothetical protein, partial [Brevibacillus agri]|uniref:hypothetical protein n=1 Tax=Brevibacillus agri TaxID=51101 RepID=UPI003D246783